MAKPKINLANINRQMERVEAEYEDTVIASRSMQLEPGEILLNPDNTAAEHDDADSIRELADSIEAAGLIHPLTVNKIADHQYMLLSGERRYKAITTHLHWDHIPCMVYENLDPDMVSLVTIEANMAVREYTVADRLALYAQLDKTLRALKDKGKYKGGIGRGIAKMLGVSEQQIGKYKKLASSLSPEELAGVTNINTAIAGLNPPKTETEVKFSSPSAPSSEDPMTGFWMTKIGEAMKHVLSSDEQWRLYNQYRDGCPAYIQIKAYLKPANGFDGSCGWSYKDGILGGIERCSDYIEVEYGDRRTVAAYGQLHRVMAAVIGSGIWEPDGDEPSEDTPKEEKTETEVKFSEASENPAEEPTVIYSGVKLSRKDARWAAAASLHGVMRDVENLMGWARDTEIPYAQRNRLSVIHAELVKFQFEAKLTKTEEETT